MEFINMTDHSVSIMDMKGSIINVGATHIRVVTNIFLLQ